jgi:hypothetical protein
MCVTNFFCETRPSWRFEQQYREQFIETEHNQVSTNGEPASSSAPLPQTEPTWNFPICERYFADLAPMR